MRRTLGAALKDAGYRVSSAGMLKPARALVRRQSVSAVIVDPGDPASAVKNVTDLRARTDAAIIVVTAPSDDLDPVDLLDAGADDCLTKPFRIEELLARLRAALRPRIVHSPNERVTTADFAVDLDARRWVRKDGTELRLTPTEWRLVTMLLQRPGRLVSHEELLAGVWGPDGAGHNDYVRVYLTGIRRKAEPNPARPRYFVTVPGVGLRFDPGEESAAS